MNKYNYRVIWSDEDQEHVGLCTEFPLLSWLDPDPDKAFKGIRKVVAEVVKDKLSRRLPIPEQLITKKYSGKFVVRIPPEVHQKLTIEAAEANVSLNRLVSVKLTRND